jgi:hypothetical protein
MVGVRERLAKGLLWPGDSTLRDAETLCNRTFIVIEACVRGSGGWGVLSAKVRDKAAVHIAQHQQTRTRKKAASSRQSERVQL